MKRANLAQKNRAKTGVTNKSARKKLLPFVTQYHPALPSLKRIQVGKWHLIQNQQRLREIFKEPPLISYRKGKSLKDLLVKAKLWRSYNFQNDKVKGSCDFRRSFLTMFNNLKCYACRFPYKNFLYVSPLAGFFFFSDKLPLQEFFWGNCHPL